MLSFSRTGTFPISATEGLGPATWSDHSQARNAGLGGAGSLIPWAGLLGSCGSCGVFNLLLQCVHTHFDRTTCTRTFYTRRVF